MNSALHSTISVMNFNNIRSVRSLAKKAYSPSTDFIFNNFRAGKSYSDFINHKAKQEVNDFLDRFNESNSILNETSIELKRLYLNLRENKEVSLDSDTLKAIAQKDAQINAYQIAVKQLATTQIDHLDSYDKEGKELTALGSINLSVEQDEKNHTIPSHTKNTQNNQDLLKDVAKSINTSDIKVKSSVLTDNDNLSGLSVTAKEEPIISQLTLITKNLQDVSDFLEDYGGDSRMLNKYKRRFTYLINTNEDTLGSLGIQRNNLGKLHFNRDTFIESFKKEGNLILNKLDTDGNFIDQFTQFSKSLSKQSIQTIRPENPASPLPRFNQDDFISYLSFSNSFNINAFYPTGSILDFNL